MMQNTRQTRSSNQPKEPQGCTTKIDIFPPFTVCLDPRYVGFSHIPMLIQHGFIKVENHRVSAATLCIFNFMSTGLVVNAENKK